VIGELYQTLVATERALSEAMLPLRVGPRDEDKARREADERNSAAVDALNRFIECFRANEVWLDESLASHVDTLQRALRDAWWQFTHPDPTKGEATQRGEAWDRVTAAEVPHLKDGIRAAMRELLEPSLLPSAETASARPGWRAWWPW
jgi:hypothetical protein